MLSLFFFSIDRLCRLISIFRPDRDAKLIVSFFLNNTATGNITALNNYCGEILLRGKISAVFLRKY